MRKKIILNGNNFSNLSEFYDEVEKVFTKDLNWKIGRNPNALNDILWGGFGLHDYEEPIIICWKNSEKSKKDFGYTETIKYFENILKTCHPSNELHVKEKLEHAKHNISKTLFDIILDII